jgi:lipopolysaccharide/colanic/teichoic acid biosynthesis glycosyltransferase
MMKSIIFKRLRRILGGEAPPESLQNIYARKEFLIVLNRARAQADRNGHCFALATFDVSDKTTDFNGLKDIASMLCSRVRATDAIGWFDERQLGVYLYDSNAKDAQGFCQEIIQQLGVEIPNHVYVYPYYYKQNLPASETVDGYKTSVGDGLERFEKLQYTFIDDNVPFQDQTNWYCSSNCDIADDYSNGMEPIFRRRHPLWKRAFDILVTSTILALCLPIFIAVALFVKIVSPGPIFFKQVRVGYLGRRFTLWKFRTMHVNHKTSQHRAYMQSLINNGQPMTKLEDDPSIIFLGKYLRASGVDELPQLLNVLKGEMSLIGPRPPIPYEVERYHRWFHGRFDMMPGLTGLWQVSGKNRLSFQEMIRLDIRYKKRLSFLNDIFILLRTPTAIWTQIAEQLNPVKSAQAKILKHGIKSNA